MLLFNNTSPCSFERPVVTIGFFDGVHLGHRAIIESTIAKAKELGRKSLLVTFWPHPRITLKKDAESLKLLTSLQEKQNLLENIGIDGMLVLDFNHSLASQSAEDFVKETLIKKLGISGIVLGYNHVFGKMGTGNFQLLKKMEDLGNFQAIQVNPVKLDGINVSSTKIRAALESGLLDIANAMLGKPYGLTGTIEGGKQIGRSIGYPTANISSSESLKQIPGNGVYAVWVDYNLNSYPAMLNIGIKPTVKEGLSRTIEAHIIGFKEIIYDKEITVRFIKKIRDERKFESLDNLKEQLAMDKVTTLTLLENK